MKRLIVIAAAVCLFVGCQEKTADAGQTVGCGQVVTCQPAGCVESYHARTFVRPVFFDGRIVRATRELLAPWSCRVRRVERFRRHCY